MKTPTAEIPEERITLSLICPVCGNRVDRQVNEDDIPASVRCSCGNTLSLIGEAAWSVPCESTPDPDWEPASA